MSNIRFLAQITMITKTPLKIGSGDSDFLTDAPVQKDANGLPMILGTSIAGILRERFRTILKDKEKNIFGFQERANGMGSKIIISNALLCDKNGDVIEKLGFESEFLNHFLNLPLRDHTAIDGKGVAKEHSKFDEEVVFKGSKFKFELELIDDGLSHKEWNNILYALLQDDFRLGSGSTKGFGSFEDIQIKTRVLNLDDENDLDEYINKNSSLNDTNFKWKPFKTDDDNLYQNSYTKYTLEIKPEDFFIFGSGFGDNEADNTPVMEKIITWENGKGTFTKKQILIPASSIKGALSHRTAFYYNKQNKIFADKIDDFDKYLGENNKAVLEIFGHKKELAKDKETELGKKGKILISDCFKEDKTQTKVFDHVAIDRFTGGAIDGALFQEKTTAQKDLWQIEILLEKNINDEYIEAFECALSDICSGMLPLGGATTKGHGMFIGSCFKNGDEI